MKRRARVLIADDRPTARRALRALLTLYPQVEVVGEAVDGQEAIHLVSECLPDVVLMDTQMPVMDGLEATRRIKKQWPKVRVIALTMYARYRAEALAAGADAFLLKDGAAEMVFGAILDQVQGPSGQSAKPWQMMSQGEPIGVGRDHVPGHVPDSVSERGSRFGYHRGQRRERPLV